MSITNFQILELCQTLNIPLLGVYMKDELAALKPKVGNYIINLQSTSQGEGTHWTALLIRNQAVFYFDSFGVQPPEEVVNFIKRKSKKGYIYNTFDIQALNSQFCGFYCMHLLKFVETHKQQFVNACNAFVNL